MTIYIKGAEKPSYQELEARNRDLESRCRAQRDLLDQIMGRDRSDIPESLLVQVLKQQNDEQKRDFANALTRFQAENKKLNMQLSLAQNTLKVELLPALLAAKAALANREPYDVTRALDALASASIPESARR